MKSIALATSEASGLAALVERFFEEEPGRGDGSAGTIPRRLWEGALLDPVREFLQRPGKEFRARLVETCYALAGAKAPCPAELPLVVELLHAGSLIVDDIEDGSLERRGAPALHQLFGTPLALNTGNWLYFLPLVLLDRLELGAEATLSLYQQASLALLRCHQGQALDLSTQVTELEQSEVAEVVAMTTRLKTGSLMELAAQLGSIAGGGDSTTVRALGRLGHELGVALQMLDDLGGLSVGDRLSKGVEDLRLCRPTWPWAWLAEELEGGEFARLQQRTRAITSDDGAAEIAETMRDHLSSARSRVRAHLEDALDSVRSQLAGARELTALEAEIARLEESYG